jgi:hypothetical protein
MRRAFPTETTLAVRVQSWVRGHEELPIGKVSDGDVTMSPQRVAGYPTGGAVDLGVRRYDECFGHGRIDALRALTRTGAPH